MADGVGVCGAERLRRHRCGRGPSHRQDRCESRPGWLFSVEVPGGRAKWDGIFAVWAGSGEELLLAFEADVGFDGVEDEAGGDLGEFFGFHFV